MVKVPNRAVKSNKPKKTPKINNSNEFHSQFIKRILMYSLFGLLTIILTILVFYRAKGYTFTKSGQVEKRGIVLVDSAPVSAKIFLDGKEVDKTDSKLEVPEGDHSIRLEAEGYKTWQRSFSINREEVVWFYYPYLIPNQLSVQSYIANTLNKQYSKLSSNGEVLSLSKTTQNNSEVLNLELLNLKEDDPAKASTPLIIPTTLFTKSAKGTYGEIKFSDWSPNGDSIFLEHSYDGKKELINLRTKSPAESQNLTRSLNTDIKESHYDSKSKLYLLSSGELASYDPKSLTKDASIAKQVTGFQVFADNKFAYSQNTDTGSALFVQDGQNAAVKVLNLNTEDTSKFDYKYIINRRNAYLAVSNADSKDLQIFKNPLDTIASSSIDQLPVPLYFATFSELKSTTIEDSPGSSSQPGMYLALQLSSSKFFIYDFEEESSFSYNLSLKDQPDKQLDVSSFNWLDSHRLQGRTSQGEVYYFDYDGNYLNLIGNTNQELSFFLKTKNRVYLVNNADANSNQLNLINFKK